MADDRSSAGELTLVGGNAALDFANTVSGLGTPYEVEHLRTAASLRDWAVRVGISSSRSAEAREMEEAAIAKAWLAEAIEVRSLVHRIGVGLARRREPSCEDLSLVRDHAADNLRRSRFARAGDRFEPDFRAAPFPYDVLGTVAWSALELLRAGREERIKVCPAEDCGWLFLDGSKNNSRVWCDMAVCGNRMKARRHRARAVE